MKTKTRSEESGSAILYAMIFLSAIIALAGFSIEMQRLFDVRRDATSSLDAAVAAGARYMKVNFMQAGCQLETDPDPCPARYQDIKDEVRLIAQENGFIINDSDIEIGFFDDTVAIDRDEDGNYIDGIHPCPSCNVVFPFQTTGVTRYNAIRVVKAKTMNTILGRVLGIQSLTPTMTTIGMVGPADEACVIPFGLTEGVIPDPPDYVNPFIVPIANSGNWGKIDINGQNMSSGTAFIAAMTAGNCQNIFVGQTLQPAPGAGGINPNNGVKDGFTLRMAANPVVIMPVVTPFPNGNSGTVTVLRFVTAQIIGVNQNGSNWEVTFQLLPDSFGNGAGGPGFCDPSVAGGTAGCNVELVG